MKVRAIFTDLDGTLLEPDGSLRIEVMAEIQRVTAAGIPVCLVTSKTAIEVVGLLARLHLETLAGFENGAGIVDNRGSVVFDPAAIPVEELRLAATRLRGRCGAPLRTLDELDDFELTALTGLAEPRFPRRGTGERPCRWSWNRSGIALCARRWPCNRG